MLFRSDRKSTRLNSSHTIISYAVFCLKKKEDEQRPVAERVHAKEPAPPHHLPSHRHGADYRYHGQQPDALGRDRQPAVVFFFNDTATTEIYTLSLHDALPI